MTKEERVVKYINSSDDFVVNGKRYCENDFYNDVEDLAKENKELKEAIDKVSSQIKLYGKYNGEKCTRGFSMMAADFNKLLDILKEVNK